MANLKDKIGAVGQYLKGDTEHVVTDMGEAPSGVDPQQWSSNPYAEFDYRHTGWQKMLESFGFRTNYDAFKESMAMQAREYAASLADKAHNEEFDSAAAQAARERAAGINPDLAGNVDAGSSSPLTDDGNPPIAPEGFGMDNPMAFGSAIMSGITSIFGLAQSGVGVAQMFADYKSQVLDNDKKALGNAVDALLASSYGSTGENSDDELYRIFGNDKNSMLYRIYGKRGARRYHSAVNALRTSLLGQSKEYGMRGERAHAKSDYYDIAASPGYSEFTPMLKIVRGELSYYNYEAEKIAKQTGVYKNLNEQYRESNVVPSKNEFESEYYQAADGAEMYQTDVESKKSKSALERAQEYRYKMMDNARETIDRLIKRFSALGDEGSFMGNLGAILMSLIEARFFSQ